MTKVGMIREMQAQNFVTSRVGPEIGGRGADTSTERGGVEGLVV